MMVSFIHHPPVFCKVDTLGDMNTCQTPQDQIRRVCDIIGDECAFTVRDWENSVSKLCKNRFFFFFRFVGGFTNLALTIGKHLAP